MRLLVATQEVYFFLPKQEHISDILGITLP